MLRMLPQVVLGLPPQQGSFSVAGRHGALWVVAFQVDETAALQMFQRQNVPILYSI